MVPTSPHKPQGPNPSCARWRSSRNGSIRQTNFWLKLIFCFCVFRWRCGSRHFRDGQRLNSDLGPRGRTQSSFASWPALALRQGLLKHNALNITWKRKAVFGSNDRNCSFPKDALDSIWIYFLMVSSSFTKYSMLHRSNLTDMNIDRRSLHWSLNNVFFTQMQVERLKIIVGVARTTSE